MKSMIAAISPCKLDVVRGTIVSAGVDAMHVPDSRALGA